MDATKRMDGSRNLFMIFMSFFLGRTIAGERHKRFLPTWVGSDEHECRPHSKTVLCYTQTVYAREVCQTSREMSSKRPCTSGMPSLSRVASIGSASAMASTIRFLECFV